MTIDDGFVNELLHSWNILLIVIQSLRVDEIFSLSSNVSVSYIANRDSRTAGRLCHMTKRFIHADFPWRIRGSAIHN